MEFIWRASWVSTTATREGLDAAALRGDFQRGAARSAGDLDPATPRASLLRSRTASTPSRVSSPWWDPKATADPFGLRRAAYGAVQALVGSNTRCDLPRRLAEGGRRFSR